MNTNNNTNNNSNNDDNVVDELLQSIIDHIHNHPTLIEHNNLINNQTPTGTFWNTGSSFSSIPSPISINIPGIPTINENIFGNITSDEDSNDTQSSFPTIIDLTEEEEEEEITTVENAQQTEPIEDCPICYKPINSHTIVNTPCGHNTCSKCFFRWIKTNPNCPICRLDFTSWERLSFDDINKDLEEFTNLYRVAIRNHNKKVHEEKVLSEKMKHLKEEFKTITLACNRRREMTDYIRGYNHAIMIGENDKIPYYEEAQYCKGYIKGCRERNYFLNAMGIRKHHFLNYHPTKVLYKKIIKNKPVRIIRRSRHIKKKLLDELLLHHTLKDDTTST